jgi:hypothetical protein
VYYFEFRKLGFVEYDGDMKDHPSLLNVVLRRTVAPSRVCSFEHASVLF